LKFTYDVIVLGAGAAGLFCAAQAGQRGRRVCVIDHAKKPAEKVRISGGGRCNFTNLDVQPGAYISQNPHFCKSALKQYTQFDFITAVSEAGIAWHEKTLGQLFCDESSKDIIVMLLKACDDASVDIFLEHSISNVDCLGPGFNISANDKMLTCASLVVATGGLSIPKMGATGFAYKLAEQLGVNVVETTAGLVPYTFSGDLKELMASLSGVATPATLTAGGVSFSENVLFTHRGLSGPSALQTSSYWKPGEALFAELLPANEVERGLKSARQTSAKKSVSTVLAQWLPSRLAQAFATDLNLSANIGSLSNADIERVVQRVSNWTIKPTGTEGYRTAEVTLGGIDTDALSSKTMEVKDIDGLYFIGEAVDVTGWLGGYNFQWAWSSAWVAGQNA
jgi:predicted Rossmann fold flavoprotein